ncbi:flagellar basal-body MS-ring/collar protein FliF [Qingshengfaniella alkalisoli]|uniref:Flagellar M-ring protein n=1 Tax=Qingshengfaniella alkalisoli TaxID=2599296 RepID=A0A5B8IX00_9RHOB|nr:flagellar basal-body MS-ring/collar protein FliF [Qingshengfaniella alkalisoli]QDY70113.1 flagellar M-ring protein FliF [Qingshengfaniella alkalisoli]
MQQLRSLWSSLDTRRRALAIGAAAVVLLAVFGLTRMAATPGMALLYSGLDNSQAGEVVSALEQQGVEYQVQGSSILVDQAVRDQLRMTLASQGLPANSGVGYELLDGLSGFGTTQQMFDAAYWRAKEGELSRTMASTPFIRAARVHISNQPATPFQRDFKPTASVTISPAAASPNEAQAQAIRYLVSSAVAGLIPEDVAVIDARTGRVLQLGDVDNLAEAGSERAAQLRTNVTRLLEARVGPGNAIVEVNVDTVTAREAITERRFDPTSRVAISTDIEEINNHSSDSGDAGVTVASNLPSGDAGSPERESKSQRIETRERTNFEVSETTREVLNAPGAIKRLTVAVLVNQSIGDAEPRSAAELQSFQQLVASAVGFDESRGDIITIEAMPFEATAVPVETETATSLLEQFNPDPMRLIQLATLAIVALVLGLFVLRPILAGRRAELETPALTTETEPVMQDITPDTAARETSTGELPSTAVTEAPKTISTPQLALPKLEDDPAGHLKHVVADRQPDTLEILKSWLEEDPTAEPA